MRPDLPLAPYRIAWGGDPETVDTSFVIPEGADLASYIGHCWGYLVGSAGLGDSAVDEGLLRVGGRKIERLGEPGYTSYPFLEFLLVNVPSPYKAAVVRWVLNRAFDPAVTQPFLFLAWRLWHHMVLHAAGWDQGRVIAWFRRARFDDPQGPRMRGITQLWMLDERMTVWRGGWGVRPDVLAQGLSWTPNKAAAAFFATRFRKGGGTDPACGPVIVRREITLAEVLMPAFLSPSEIVAAPSDSWATDTEPHGWEAMGRGHEAIRDQMIEMAQPEMEAMLHETPEAKLGLFLRTSGKTREDLERAIGRKVRLAAGNAAHA